MPAIHRIGAVSRLAGVPVTTLRVWETRYAAFAPAKTSGRHRLYRDEDAIKARLMRQLADAGHRVGGIAHLSIQQLQELLSHGHLVPGDLATPQASRQVSAVIVGAAVAARINAPEWRERFFGGSLRIRQVFVDLEQAAQPVAQTSGPVAAADATGILVVRLNTIHARTHGELLAAIERQRVQRVIVLYNYGPDVLVESLRGAGIMVRREPVPDADLAELIRSVVMLDAAGALPAAGGLIPRRRYSEATLARVVSSPNAVVCACPRHIAELVGQIANFEDYSEQCLNDNREDAALHAYLRSVAGSARVLFEQALQRAARHGGLTLEEDAANI